MRPSSTARRYAEAAFDVARQDGDVEGWLSDLRRADQVLRNEGLAPYFKDPNRAMDEKLQFIERLFGALRPHVLNLLRILITRHRLHLLPSVVAEFEHLERQARGIADADVTVARQVGHAEKAKIERQLGQLFGKQVQAHLQIDPQILGGIVVRIEDRLIDASVAGRLQRLRQHLAV